MSKDYFEVREWLETYIPQTYSNKNLGLERIEFLLKLLGNPEKKFKSIHVGGTSGKGSTAFYIARLLEFAGPTTNKVKVGLHMSPHLIYLGERMQVNGKEISVSRLVRLMNEIKPVVAQMKGSRVGEPSYFEILVAASFKYFADEKVDFAVVEVGLGGRLDATNVLEPQVSVITNVGLDHTEILGKTLSKIANEKAGIIKKNTPVVTGASGKALAIIEKRSKEKKASLININTLSKRNVLKSDLFKYFSIYRLTLRDSHTQLALFNQKLAIAAVYSLKVILDKKVIESSFNKSLEGRIEEIQPSIILDGAHNVDKIRFLVDFFRNSKLQTPNSKIILILAFKNGKDWKKMVDLLLDNLPVKKVIATKFYAVTDTGKLSAVEPKEIIQYVSSIKNQVAIKAISNSHEAVFEALNSYLKPVTGDQILLVTGSLYLVGEVRTLWQLPKF